jgi:FkbM family methyltransferase
MLALKLLKVSYKLIQNGRYCFNELMLALCSQIACDDKNKIGIYLKLITKLGGHVLSETRDFFRLKVKGLIWNVRKIIYTDFKFGVLLDLIGEPYQYWMWFDKYIDNAETFIDVGAYIGGYSVRALRKNVDVYAIEANPENYELLIKNLKMNCDDKSVFSYNVAAGSRRVRKPLYIDASTDRYLTSSLLGKGNPVGVVDVYPLDDLLVSKDLKKPIFVKIDVEGVEFDVIKGAKRILAETNYVMVETTMKNMLFVDKIFNYLNFKKVDSYRCYSLYVKQ